MQKELLADILMIDQIMDGRRLKGQDTVTLATDDIVIKQSGKGYHKSYNIKEEGTRIQVIDEKGTLDIIVGHINRRPFIKVDGADSEYSVFLSVTEDRRITSSMHDEHVLPALKDRLEHVRNDIITYRGGV